MRIFTLYRVVITILLISVPAVVAQSGPSKEEYRVYDAVIREMVNGGKLRFTTSFTVELVVIKDKTVTNNEKAGSPEKWERVKQRLPGLTEQMIQDYNSKPKEKDALRRSFDPGLKYVLRPAGNLEKLVLDGSSDAWPKFYEQYPKSGGFIGFSRVGFSKYETDALVYVEYWCRSLCGEGTYVLLRKEGEAWIVQEANMVWIS